MKEKSKRKLTLSVHGLVDFLLRVGDIDNRIYNQDTMQMGSLIHLTYQRSKDPSYISEYAFKETFERAEAIITLEGRADGIIEGLVPVIEEIKSSIIPVREFFEEQKEWHLGQAECYALMYLHEKGKEKCRIRLVYISQKDENDTFTYEEEYDLLRLEEKVYGYMDEYLSFQKRHFDHIKERNASSKELAFPFDEFRPGQRQMAKYIYSVSKKGGTIFVEAPTGIGKTVSALYPSLKALGERQDGKIFYLCAKNSGRLSAHKAMGEIYKAGYKGRDSLLTSKEKMCFCQGAGCNPDECPFAKGYYTKIKEAIVDSLDHSNRFDYDFVNSQAEKYRICPFELQLDLSNYADVVIGDYNYFFDPLSKLERFFGEGADPSNDIVLVDEAHNLLKRGQDMYSASLDTEMIDEAKKDIKKWKSPSLKKSLTKLSFSIEKGLGDDEEIYEIDAYPQGFKTALANFQKAMRDLDKNPHPPVPKSLKDLSKEARRFTFLVENYPQGTLLYLKRHKRGVSFNLLSMDASKHLHDSLKEVKGKALFSATFSPISYYMDSLSSSEDAYLMLPSPFPKENFKLLVSPVSTRYKDRDKTYKEVASLLKRFVSKKLGNYFLFMPSYEYLDKIQEYLEFKDADVYVQEKEMKETDKEDFLSCFKPNPTKTTIGLLVLGGSFSEGIDLVDDRLIGVAVVGIGLPTVSFEKEKEKDYFDKKNGHGYSYAYINPGMNRVMQAVGRLIRSEKDVGAALLIDERYLQHAYRDLFLQRYSDYEVVMDPDDLEKSLDAFYKKKKTNV